MEAESEVELDELPERADEVDVEIMFSGDIIILNGCDDGGAR